MQHSDQGESAEGTRHSLRHNEATSNEENIQQSAHSPVKPKKRCSRQASTLSTGSGSVSTRFIMIPKSFNEEVLVTSHGPKQELTYNSACSFDHRRYYKSSVEYNHRYAPKMYETTLIVTPDTKDYVYRERVDLVPRLIARNFSETITTYPKKVEKVYTTTLTHWDDYKERKYVTGVELVQAEKLKSYKEFRPEPNEEDPVEEQFNGHDGFKRTSSVENECEEYNERL